MADFNMLLAGRILGGISTSLLFSVLESWMVAEHNNRGYHEDLLSSTFYVATFMNGIVAILAGLWSSFSATRWGFVSPFMWALGLLIICTMLVMLSWTENYGNSTVSLEFTFRNSFQYLTNDRVVIKLGFIQSLFEASMYTFVFMWTPTLQESGAGGPDEPLPFGLIFATFMVCIMIGSSIFNLIHIPPERLARYIFAISIACMAVPFVIKENSFIIYISFLVFETCCGMYFPCMGTLRSKYIPESARASIMNYFRVPLNFMVVIVLSNISKISTTNIFFVCTMWLVGALALQSTPKIFNRRPHECLTKGDRSDFIQTIRSPLPALCMKSDTSSDPQMEYDDENISWIPFLDEDDPLPGQCCPYATTSEFTMAEGLNIASVDKDDVLLDVGCGDGRIPIFAAKTYGIRSIGIDINPDLIAKANKEAIDQGVSHLVLFKVVVVKLDCLALQMKSLISS
eukprot:gene19065-22830_t